jgi:hypothetical protein
MHDNQEKFRQKNECFPLVKAVCCQVEVSATDRSLVQRSPTNCGCVIVCDPETSRMRRPWPASGCCDKEKKNIYIYTHNTFLPGFMIVNTYDDLCLLKKLDLMTSPNIKFYPLFFHCATSRKVSGSIHSCVAGDFFRSYLWNHVPWSRLSL